MAPQKRPTEVPVNSINVINGSALDPGSCGSHFEWKGTYLHGASLRL
jgi:hypothetical protein